MRPGRPAFRCRQMWRVSSAVTCSSVATGGRTRSPAASLCSAGGVAHAGVFPGRRRRQKCSSSRSASPSGVWYSSRKWPPQDSLRSSASRHISSPSSKKSATRPAFSSDWFTRRPLPGTFTSRQNRSRSAGICRAPASALGRARPCRSTPTSSCPVAVEQSTGRVPLMASSRLWSRGHLGRPSRTAGWRSSTFSSLCAAR